MLELSESGVRSGNLDDKKQLRNVWVLDNIKKVVSRNVVDCFFGTTRVYIHKYENIHTHTDKQKYTPHKDSPG